MRHDYCDLCCSYSVKRGRCINTTCLGLTDEEWCVRDAQECYVRGDLSVTDLEQRVEDALAGRARRNGMRLSLVWR